MKSAAQPVLEPASNLAVRRWLASGQSHASLLYAERRALTELQGERERVRQETAAAMARAPEVLNGGQPSIDAHTRLVTRLDLQSMAVATRIEQAQEAIKLLENPLVQAQFKFRDAETTRKADSRVRALEDLEEHLGRAAACVRLVGNYDALLRGVVQRFADLIGDVALPGGLISPAVRHRRGESLASIFGGATRSPEPPRAA